MQKVKVKSFKLHVGKFWGMFFIIKKNESIGLINLLVTSIFVKTDYRWT